MKTRLFLLIFALVASISLFAQTSGTCGENLSWNFTNDVLTISGTGDMDNFDYPTCAPWYNLRTEISSVVINENVTSIGISAFTDCIVLTSVSIPNSVTSIGENAFSNCGNLTSPIYNTHVFAYMPESYSGAYTILSGIECIAAGAFSGCTGLTSVTIPNSVTSIGRSAFSRCSGLTSVTIPNSVTSIGDGAFSGCGLSYPLYNSHVFAYLPTSYSGAYTIPDGIELIAGRAVRECSSLSSITIPNSVASIGYGNFSTCTNLSLICVDAGNTHYDSRDNCNAIIETSSNTLIAGCKNAIIPNNVTSIGDGAFVGCSSLTSIAIPNSVTNIGLSAFESCYGLTDVTIPNSVEIIGQQAFLGCSSLTSVTIGNSVTSIGDYAFYGCYSLTDVTIPNSVEIIGQEAFLYCSSLTSITIGNSATSIGRYAFVGCPNLASVTCYAINSPIANYVFYSISGSAILYVLNESLSAYASDGDWNDYFVEIRPITTSVTIGSTGWASFSHGYPIDLTETNHPDGLAAYQVQAANIISEENTIAPSAINTSVAANTGLLLNGEEGTYDILVASSGSDLSSTNKLVAVTEDGTVVNNASYYVLMNNNGTAVFAHTGEHAATLNKGMAYLDLSGIALAPGILNIVEDMTDIEALGESQETIRKFITDGKLYIQRDSVTYDTLGRIVR